MLLGGSFGEWLEPVGNVGYPVFQSPLFHTCCYLVCSGAVEILSSFNSVQKRFERVGIEIAMHFGTVKDELSEIFGGPYFRTVGRNGFLFERLLNEIRSVHRSYFLSDSSFFWSFV